MTTPQNEADLEKRAREDRRCFVRRKSDVDERKKIAALESALKLERDADSLLARAWMAARTNRPALNCGPRWRGK
jgi:hypothetical protein